jgi:hypothetical protein
VRRHLQEERLLDCYLAERSGIALDPPAAEHLADCSACGARYVELSQFMDTIRTEGAAHGDEVFTAERLRTQHQHIMRRIEHVGRAARVISFPGPSTNPPTTGSTSSSAPRWIAAAAAAGLFIGVAVGASFQWNARIRHPFAADSSRLNPVATRGTGQPDVASDAAFLSELEIALERPHTRELQAFDTFTPHVREVNDSQ